MGLGCIGLTGSEKQWDLVLLENSEIREKECHRVILL